MRKFSFDEAKDFIFDYICDKYGIEFGKEVYFWPKSAVIIFLSEIYKGNFELEI